MTECLSLDQVPARLLAYLRQMDREAINKSYYGGQLYPTGLREYPNHHHPNLDPNVSPAGVRYEDEWTRRIIELLQADGVLADPFPTYPDGRRKADFLIRCQSGDSLWIEVKGAWTYNLHPRVRGNGAFRKHLTSASEGVPKDFLKLDDVPPSLASNVGILLVGFEAPAHGFLIGDSELALMKQVAKFDRFTWSEHRDEWQDGIVADSRVRCWLWYRPSRAPCADASTVENQPPISAVAPPSVAKSTAQPREEMIRRLRALIRQNHDLHGENWIWGDYYVEVSACCGIEVEKPEGMGRRNSRDPTRRRFARAIRAVIPYKEYNFRRGWEAAPEIVDAVLAFHLGYGGNNAAFAGMPTC